MKQKLLTLLFMAFVPIAMMAYDAVVDNIYYYLDNENHTATVTNEGYGYFSYSEDVVIPETFNYDGWNYTVTGIGYDAFWSCVYLNSVVIPNTVTIIKDNAFCDCVNLRSIVISARLTSIGEDAFNNCINLSSFTIPEGVETIGAQAFMDCFALQSINIPSTVTSIGEDAFTCDAVRRTDALESITVADGNTVYDSRGGCNAIIETATNKLLFGCKNTVIPEGVTTIAKNAFRFRRMSTISIPSSVTTVEDNAFYNCRSLTSVYIYNNSIVKESVFNYVGKDEDCNLYVPKRFDLGDYTVSDDKIQWQGGTFILNRLPYDIALDGIYYVLNDNQKKASVMFNNSDFQPSYSGDVKIPESITYNDVVYDVTDINSYAFFECKNLTSVFIPSSVTNIGFWAFKDCSNLASLIFFGDQVSIGNLAFDGVGTNDNPCMLYVPKGFDFGDIDTSGDSFLWYDGYFSLESMKISITAAGMGTYCSPYDLDFTNVTGLKAYIITGYDWINRKVYATRVYDVPAGTGLYLVGKPGDYTLEMGNTGSYYINMLVGTLVETWIEPTDGDLTNLRLTGSSAQDASFKTFTAPRTFSANRAYLQIPTAVLDHSANAVGIVFDDEADGIEGISQNTGETDNNWFTLDGRKLNGKPTTKGVYVVKGRKVVVK